MAANDAYTHEFSGNYPIVLAMQMQYQTIKQTVWGRWFGYTTPKGRFVKSKQDANPVDKIVVVHNQLAKQGQRADKIEIPMLRNLNQMPVFGRTELQRREERFKVNFAQIPVDVVRHGVLTKDGEMSGLTMLNQLKSAEPELRLHYIRVIEYLLGSCAMYWGFSYNVLKSDWWASDTNIAANSHPHIYIAGTGKVSYDNGNPGSSGYEGEIGDQLDAMAASAFFDTGFLNWLAVQTQVQKIKPVVMNDGNMLWLCMAHPWQVAQLVADPNFNQVTALARAQAYAKANPMLYRVNYVYGKFAIFETDTAVWPVRTDSDGDPEWGPSGVLSSDPKDLTLESFETYSTDTMFAGFILGSNALGITNVGRMKFKYRMDDYDAIEATAYVTMTGASRMDQVNRDDGTQGDNVVQQNSAVFVTKAYEPPIA